jgi:hypothetical protein
VEGQQLTMAATGRLLDGFVRAVQYSCIAEGIRLLPQFPTDTCCRFLASPPPLPSPSVSSWLGWSGTHPPPAPGQPGFLSATRRHVTTDYSMWACPPA